MSLIKKIIKLLKGDYDSAISDYTKAIKLNPQFAAAYNIRGLAYALKGLKDLAISDFKKSTNLGIEKAREILKEFFNIDY